MGYIRLALLGSLLLMNGCYVYSYGSIQDCYDREYSPICTSSYRAFPNDCYYEMYHQGGYGDREDYSNGLCYEEGHPNYNDQFPQDEYSSNYRDDTSITIVNAPAPYGGGYGGQYGGGQYGGGQYGGGPYGGGGYGVPYYQPPPPAPAPAPMMMMVNMAGPPPAPPMIMNMTGMGK